MLFIVFGLSIFLPLIIGGTIPLDINLQDPNEINNLTCPLSLPNNDKEQAGLTFRLLTYTHLELPHNAEETTARLTTDALSDDYSSTKSFDETRSSVEIFPEKKLITVGEAIEGFRQDLIRKESEIAGIIESPSTFYRHFKLEFDGNKELTIRCTYDSNYEERTLNIACYVYHEVNRQRLLSSSEVEVFNASTVDEYHINFEFVDLKSVKQTYQFQLPSYTVTSEPSS